MIPAGWLPVLLWILGFTGMAWSDAEPNERLKGIDSFFKLLAIPLLLMQFRSSNNGERIIPAYFISCLLLLAASSWRLHRRAMALALAAAALAFAANMPVLLILFGLRCSHP
jgi:predicted branched-subunit amino acid permease